MASPVPKPPEGALPGSPLSSPSSPSASSASLHSSAVSAAFNAISAPTFSPGAWLDACIETCLEQKAFEAPPGSSSSLASSPETETARSADRLESILGSVLAEVQRRTATTFEALDTKSQDLSSAAPTYVKHVEALAGKLADARRTADDTLNALTCIDIKHQESLRRLAALDALRRHFHRCRRVLLVLHQWDFRVGEIELLLHSFQHQETPLIADPASPVDSTPHHPHQPSQGQWLSDDSDASSFSSSSFSSSASSASSSSAFEHAASTARLRSLAQAALHAAALKNAVQELKAFGEFSARVRAAELLERRVVVVTRSLMRSAFLSADAESVRVAMNIFATLNHSSQLQQELAKCLGDQLRRTWLATWARTPAGRRRCEAEAAAGASWALAPNERPNGDRELYAGEQGDGFPREEADACGDDASVEKEQRTIGETEALLLYFEEFTRLLEERSSLLRLFADELSQAEIRASHASSDPSSTSSRSSAHSASSSSRSADPEGVFGVGRRGVEETSGVAGAASQAHHRPLRLHRAASLLHARVWEETLLLCLKVGGEAPNAEVEAFLAAAGADLEEDGEERMAHIEKLLQTYETCVTLVSATPVVAESEPHIPQLWRKISSTCLFFPALLLRQFNAALWQSSRRFFLQDAPSARPVDKRQAPSQVVMELEGRLDRTLQRLSNPSVALYPGAFHLCLVPCLLSAVDDAVAEFLSSLSPVLQTFTHTIQYKTQSLQDRQSRQREKDLNARGKTSDFLPLDVLPTSLPFDLSLLNTCMQQYHLLASAQQKLAQGAAVVFEEALAGHRRHSRFNIYIRELINLHPDLLVFPSPSAVAHSASLLPSSSSSSFSAPPLPSVLPASFAAYTNLLHSSRALVLLACSAPCSLFLHRFYPLCLGAVSVSSSTQSAQSAQSLLREQRESRNWQESKAVLPSSVSTAAGEFFLQLLPHLELAAAGAKGSDKRETEMMESSDESLIAGLLSVIFTAFCRALLVADLPARLAKAEPVQRGELREAVLLQLQADARYLASLSRSLGYDPEEESALLLFETESMEGGDEAHDAQADKKDQQTKDEKRGISDVGGTKKDEKDEAGREKRNRGPTWMIGLLLWGLDALLGTPEGGTSAEPSAAKREGIRNDVDENSSSSGCLGALLEAQLRRKFAREKHEAKGESPSDSERVRAACAAATAALESPASDLCKSVKEREEEEVTLVWALLFQLGVFPSAL
ncbi:UNVERIFIED_CONTAM: hypothetical protein HHA_242030 [Hammondia hammondi]|eukprot:XP_008884444.1 hypothetical protein HHA_242030 [Hammondia hammondi]